MTPEPTPVDGTENGENMSRLSPWAVMVTTDFVALGHDLREVGSGVALGRELDTRLRRLRGSGGGRLHGHAEGGHHADRRGRRDGRGQHRNTDEREANGWSLVVLCRAWQAEAG